MIKTSATPDEDFKKLKEYILSLPKTELIKETPNYYHFVFTSGWFKFQDDVELVLNMDKKGIDFRSASRTGHSDFGANKKRIEKMRQHLISSRPSKLKTTE